MVISKIQELQKTFLSKDQAIKKIDIGTGKEVEVNYHLNELNLKADFNVGYDASQELPMYANMFKAGIIDPTKVVTSALSNAVSAAAMFLTTEAVVTDIPEKKEKNMGGGMPAGMDMGM